jgi:tetratricopeptide (TPR) repeat protein
MRLQPRPPRSLRSICAGLLWLCAWATFPPAYAGQAGRNDPAAETLGYAASARRAIAHGQLDEAEAAASRRPPDDAAAAAVRGQIAALRGRYEDALAILEPVARAQPGTDAALQLGLLQQLLGRRQEASRVLQGVLREVDANDAEALFRAARAAQALRSERDANSFYRGANAVSADPAIDTAWGLLFLEKYNKPEALRSLQEAIKADPEWAPAHAGLARVLADENPPAASAAANRALEIDPQLADAHLLLAELDLNNSRWDEARKRIDTVLGINPSHLEARSWLAAMSYVRDDRPAFEAEVKRVLGINPAYGDVYRVAADLAARNYRFEEAVALARQAIALDPSNTRAHGDLGMHLMRTGDEAEARRALERSFEDDPFDVVTYNLLSLLDTLDKFVVETSGDLIFKFHPDEAPVMREYAIPLAHEALKTLAAKYQLTPKGPILIEVFPNHDDFAVRTLGLPGMIGALGACFGRVVTMDSPKAQQPGTFSWQATLWHELAHVITLQLSNQRVPRWLTEGISVYEEAQARPEWGRDMEVPFARMLQRGEVLKVKDLNAGFTRPETIGLAYYQASLLVDHIVATHGLDAVRKLLAAYGQGAEGEEALTRGLGASTEQLQASFDKSLQARFAPLLAALGDTAKEGAKPEAGERDLAALEEAANANPGSYAAQMALGRALASTGDARAFAPLERAARLIPQATGENNPNALIADLATKLDDLPRAIRAYRDWLAHDHAAVEPARRLQAIAEKAGDQDAARLAFERVVALDPFDSTAHVGAGRVALARGDAAVASREFRAALMTGVQDKASVHCDLAESYLRAGRSADAKKEALAALEIAPSFERAQDLLLRAVEGGKN